MGCYPIPTFRSHLLPSQPPPVSAGQLPNAPGPDPTPPLPVGYACSEKPHRSQPLGGGGGRKRKKDTSMLRKVVAFKELSCRGTRGIIGKCSQLRKAKEQQ